MASSRFVLPSPFAPSTTVRPSANSTSAAAYDRKSLSQRCRTCKSRHSNRHEQVEELVALRRSHHGRLQGIERGDDHLVPRSDLDAVEQVLRIERNGELRPLVLRIELLVGLA